MGDIGTTTATQMQMSVINTQIAHAANAACLSNLTHVYMPKSCDIRPINEHSGTECISMHSPSNRSVGFASQKNVLECARSHKVAPIRATRCSPVTLDCSLQTSDYMQCTLNRSITKRPVGRERNFWNRLQTSAPRDAPIGIE